MRKSFRSRRKASLSIVGAILFSLYWAFGSWYERPLREAYVHAGVPQAQDFDLEHWTRIFRNQAYLVGYSEWRRNPL